MFPLALLVRAGRLADRLRGRLAGNTSRSGRRAGEQRYLPKLEGLESRRLLSAYRFDFSGPDKPAAYGSTPATTALYSPALGHGWTAGDVVGWKDRGDGQPLTMDFDFATQAAFRVDLPNGFYAVAPTLGDVAKAHGVAISCQGQAFAPIYTAAGQFVHPVYRVQVTNGQLSLNLKGGQLGASSPFFAIEGLEITPVGLSGFVSVKDFGAQGDGVTNDAPAIQQAIDALPAAGGVVYLPAGTYRLATPAGSVDSFPDGSPELDALLIRKSHVIFTGEGASSILKLGAYTQMRALAIISSDVTIENLAVDGNRGQRNASTGFPTGDVVSSLINARETSSHVTVRECDVHDGLEDGVGLWDSPYGAVIDVTSHDNGTDVAGAAGIAVGGEHNHGSIVANCTAARNTAAGIWLSFGVSDVLIVENTITGNTKAGIAVCGDSGPDTPVSTGVRIIDNLICQNGSAGHAAVNIVSSQDGLFIGNRVMDNELRGIDFSDQGTDASRHWVVSQNTFGNSQSGGQQYFGIRALGLTADIQVSDNTWVNDTGVLLWAMGPGAWRNVV